MKRRAFATLEMLIFLFVIGIPFAFWTQRTLEFWVSRSKEVPVDVHWGLCYLCNIFAPFVILGNLVSEIVRLAIS